MLHSLDNQCILPRYDLKYESSVAGLIAGLILSLIIIPYRDCLSVDARRSMTMM